MHTYIHTITSKVHPYTATNTVFLFKLSKTTYTRMYIHTYIHTFIHSYIHTYTYTYIQNCISGLSTCVSWGGSNACTKFTSVGLDGRLVFWSVPKLEDMFKSMTIN